MIEEKLDTMIDLLRQLAGVKEVPAKKNKKDDAPPAPPAAPAAPPAAPVVDPLAMFTGPTPATPTTVAAAPPKREELSKALAEKIINSPKFGGAGKGGAKAIELIDSFRPEGAEKGLAGVPVTSYADLMNSINIAAAV